MAYRIMSPSECSALFPVIERHSWLNHAAISAWPTPVHQAIQSFVDDNRQFGALHYEDWMETEQQLRNRLAAFINAPSSDDISLTKNTSEGLNIIAQGLCWKPADEIILPANEFPSNMLPWQRLTQLGVHVKNVEIRDVADPTDALIRTITPKTRLVAISSVQFDTGVRLNLQKISEVCREFKALLSIDAIQHLGALPLDVQAIDPDFLVTGSHKWLMAPEGIGFLWSKAEIRHQMSVTLPGWRMYEDAFNFSRSDWRPPNSGRRFETGTLPMFAVHGLNAAVELLIELDPNKTGVALLDRSDYLIRALENQPNVQIVTPHRRESRAGIVCFRIENQDSESVVQQLAKENIYVAKRGENIRVSPHFYTPFGQLDELLTRLTDPGWYKRS